MNEMRSGRKGGSSESDEGDYAINSFPFDGDQFVNFEKAIQQFRDDIYLYRWVNKIKISGS